MRALLGLRSASGLAAGAAAAACRLPGIRLQVVQGHFHLQNAELNDRSSASPTSSITWPRWPPSECTFTSSPGSTFCAAPLRARAALLRARRRESLHPIGAGLRSACVLSWKRPSSSASLRRSAMICFRFPLAPWPPLRALPPAPSASSLSRCSSKRRQFCLDLPLAAARFSRAARSAVCALRFCAAADPASSEAIIASTVSSSSLTSPRACSIICSRQPQPLGDGESVASARHADQQPVRRTQRLRHRIPCSR